jgi:truncated hemoglobin YjbI
MFTSAFAMLAVCASPGQVMAPPPVYVTPAPVVRVDTGPVYYRHAGVLPPLISHYNPVYHHPPMMGLVPVVPAKQRTLYERLGGEAAIKAVIDDFVARSADNPKVNFFRKGTAKEWKPTPAQVDNLKKLLVEQVASAAGGPQKYTGRSMKEVHAGMGITQAEFDALAADLKASLDKFRVPAKEQDELLKIIASTAPDIVEKKN